MTPKAAFDLSPIIHVHLLFLHFIRSVMRVHNARD